MRYDGIIESLESIVNLKGEGNSHEVLLARATMALANMTGANEASPIVAKPEVIDTINKCCSCAVAQLSVGLMHPPSLLCAASSSSIPADTTLSPLVLHFSLFFPLSLSFPPTHSLLSTYVHGQGGLGSCTYGTVIWTVSIVLYPIYQLSIADANKVRSLRLVPLRDLYCRTSHTSIFHPRLFY